MFSFFPFFSSDAASDVYYSHNYTKTPEEACAVMLEV
jgi:hypothetical protein